jgi:hydrogenase-4 component B
MSLFVTALLLLAASAVSSLIFHSRPQRAALCGAGGAVLASIVGLAALFVHGGPGSGHCGSLSFPLALPGVNFHILLDPLSKLFLAPMFILCACAAVYGAGYAGHDKRTGPGFFFFNLLTVSMALVFTARDAVLFLAAWEMMTIFSFLLVVTDYSNAETRRAGWIYLVATHIGTAFLLALFALAWHKCGSTDFDAFPKAFAALPFSAVAAMALVGFGTKAGFFPLHVWLPRAHPAAPSHVSAVMSGIMIKTGIYGILRVLSLCPFVPFGFGALLAATGLVSGVLGVLFALAQHDIKRLLAYHSVENIGIIALGLGVGYMALACGRRDIAFIAFAGGLLHVVNHALFKGLLFLGAGAVYHETGLRDIDRLGGLLKIMPLTGVAFLAGCAAICALPPFNGFVSEFLIYSGAFKMLPSGGGAGYAALAVVAGLALIGGLALACFAKAFGVIFLGEPRSKTSAACDAGRLMTYPMLALAALCLLVGLLPQFAARFAAVPAAQLAGGGFAAELSARLLPVGIIAMLAALAIAALWLLRDLMIDSETSAATWGCGYTAPSAKIQYTASSFAQPLMDMFGLGAVKTLEAPQGYFPQKAAFSTHTPDMAASGFFVPVFRQIEEKLSRLSVIQRGVIHAYILYIGVALVALLVWALL